MYRIIHETGCLGLIEKPTYIRKSTHPGNDGFVLCPEEEAAGIAFGGAVYHLPGRPAIDGAKDIALVFVDAGTAMNGTNRDVTTLQEDLATTDETAIQLYEEHLEQKDINQAQDDALIELYETIGG